MINTAGSMNVVWLNSEAAMDVNQVGSKAAGLCRIRELGFPTPPGFVVTVSAFRGFIQNAGFASSLASLAACSEGEELTHRLADLGAGIQAAGWPSDVRESITTAYRALSGTVAVRSSGIVEDGEQSAFAGAFSSFLSRTGEGEVLAAVRDCWSSAFSPKVAAYRLQHQLMGTDWLMGVIVQTMVFGEKGGVMFTRDPLGDGSTILVQAVTGGCDRIVSGAPAELSVWVDRTTKKPRRVEDASLAAGHFGAGAAGLLGGPSLGTPRLLRKKEIDALVETGLRLETALGRPQDVEWVIADGKLVLLQTRPLTALRSEEEGAE